MTTMLTRGVLGIGTLLFAGSAAALSLSYDMTGSQMVTVNSSGTHTVAVSGTLTIDDDEAGNVLLTSLSLSHPSYEIAFGLPTISITIERTSIILGAGSVPGTGSTISSTVIFPSTTLAQTGTTTCTSGGLPCSFVGRPEGTVAVSPTVAVNLGNWVFDANGNFTAPPIDYTVVGGANPSTETLNLVGTIPEPGTGALVVFGLAGLALRRRARA